MNLAFATDYVFWISWKHSAGEHVPYLRHTNEVLGAYVTSGARMQLYRYLDRLGVRAIYCDTDSVMYIQPKDEPNLIETGHKLGDMTSDLRTTEYISEFVSGVPKNYAYKVIDTATVRATTVCKVRGITLNFSAKQMVNFDVILGMVLETGAEPTVTVHTEKKIKRKRKGGELWPLLPNPRIRRTESRSSNADVWPTIRRSLSGINRASVGHRSAFISRPSMDDDLKFRHSFSYIVCGPSGSGKTSFLKRFLLNFHELCTEPKIACGVVCCYGEKSALPSHLPAYIRIHEGLPKDVVSANSEPSLVILDDLLTDVYSKQVCKLFTRGIHHRNISVIPVTQYLIHQFRFCRDISLNAHYIVAFKTSEIINSSRSWLINYTPKIVWVYITSTWTLLKNPTATYSLTLHKIRTTV